MDLKIKDVAELLHVSGTTIRRWLADGKIPAYKLNGQYRFSRVEIEDWVMSQRLSDGKGNNLTPDEADNVDKEIDDDDDGDGDVGGMTQFSLYRAINKGGVLRDVPGDTKKDVISSTMSLLAEDLCFDAQLLTELFLDRERLMPTALNNGIAVPHTRDFLLNAHYDAITVVFPESHIDYGALDGITVHTMFFLFACEDKRHLNLLAKLAHFSSKDKNVEFMRSRPDRQAFLSYVKRWESSITKDAKKLQKV